MLTPAFRPLQQGALRRRLVLDPGPCRGRVVDQGSVLPTEYDRTRLKGSLPTAGFSLASKTTRSYFMSFSSLSTASYRSDSTRQ
jgi:hypothetical protein